MSTSQSVCPHTSETVLREDGFEICKDCKVIILYECDHCFCIIRHKSANHECPEYENDDEGLGTDTECYEFQNIGRYIVILSNVITE